MIDEKFLHFKNRVIIAGSRNFDDMELLDKKLIPYFAKLIKKDTLIISGGASGADTLGAIWGKDKGYSLTIFAADWDTQGKAAGPIRNKQMAEHATHLVLFWDGKSRGSASMLKFAKECNLEIKEVFI